MKTISTTSYILKILYEGLTRVRVPSPRKLRVEEKIDFPLSLYDVIPDQIRRTLQTPQFVGPIPRNGRVSPKYHYEIILPRSGRKINICIWCPGHCIDIKPISQWLHYLEENFPISNECSKKLTIFLFMTDHKKTLPFHDRQTLTEYNVNSGFTYSCMPDNQIVIFREEEWFKVFIHETMHAFGIDFSKNDILSQNATKTLLQTCFHGVKSNDLRIYECYSEFWAEIFHILFLVHKRTRRSYFDSVVARNVQNAIHNEQLWSLIQANKILKHYGIEFMDLRTGTNQYMETNHVAIFSYYILKSILYFHIEPFMKWCRRNLKMPHIYFGATKSTTESFIHHLCDWSKVPAYERALENIKTISMPWEPTNTLKMTAP